MVSFVIVVDVLRRVGSLSTLNLSTLVFICGVSKQGVGLLVMKILFIITG